MNSGASSPIRVALATCAELPQLDADTHWLVTALEKKSVRVTAAVWDDANADWVDFDLVVVRSCWVYASRRDEFLAWAERVPHLANPAPSLPGTPNPCSILGKCLKQQIGWPMRSWRKLSAN